jgi:GAF domain-containing protein
MDDGESRLAEALSELALTALSERSLKADLERLARLACRLVTDCSGASVSMTVDGSPSTVAVTDHIALQLDMVQYDHLEGPCIAALGGDAVRIGFVPKDERFPHFAVGAADRRVLSVLSTPAIDHGDVVGSLNIYSRRADAFTAADQDVALVISSEIAHALVRSTVLAKARDIRDRLQEDFDRDIVISRAEGVVMAVYDCSAAQASDLIRRAAADNAENLVATATRILSTVRTDREFAADDPTS